MEVSESGGVKIMNIQGRMGSQRERTLGMTDEERAWRAKYLKSLILDKSEPVTPENYYKELYNPIRRFYRAPLDAMERVMTPVTGEFAAGVIRMCTAKVGFGICLIYYGYYYFKYNQMTWMHRSGWRVFVSRPAVLPGNPDFPNFNHRKEGKDFCVHGFDKSPI